MREVFAVATDAWQTIIHKDVAPESSEAQLQSVHALHAQAPLLGEKLEHEVSISMLCHSGQCGEQPAVAQDALPHIIGLGLAPKQVPLRLRADILEIVGLYLAWSTPAPDVLVEGVLEVRIRPGFARRATAFQLRDLLEQTLSLVNQPGARPLPQAWGRKGIKTLLCGVLISE
eukprot:CAMPEP_0180441718 /NCGR_PEP_ID=MMETSP1036_2-20121128/13771_1 /TAXON_ID=632150 /ORGANISM="Azadinium spinosum, Strain 3D9" /LENGTH=172 /DNA_ID=CAMNT_0022447943 /DNA_START=1463 /DNA_END=1981 /DNA_ORIENTATION=-